MYNLFASFVNKRLNIDAHYFLKGGFWLSLNQGVTIILGFLSTVLFAHLLNESGYGTYRYLLSLAVIFSSFSLTGLGEAILQASAKGYTGFYNQTLKINFVYNLPIFILGIAGSTYYFLNDNITLSLGCLAIGIFQTLTNPFQFLPAFLQGTKKFKESSWVLSFKTLVVTTLTVSCLIVTQDILLIFLSYLISNFLINLLFYLLYLKSTTQTTPASIIQPYLSYAKNSSLRNLISNVAFRVDSILLFTRMGAVELAIFTIATILPEQVKGSFKNLSALLLPKYASHNDKKQIKVSVKKRSFQLFIIYLTVTLLYIFICPFVYGIFFPKYESAILLSQLFALSFPSYIYYIPLTAMMAEMEEKKLFDFHLYTSVLQFFIAIALVILFGLLGAIIARVLIQYTRMVYCYWIFYR